MITTTANWPEKIKMPTKERARYEDVMKKLEEKYPKQMKGAMPKQMLYLLRRLSAILDASGQDGRDFSALKGTAILDIACGSDTPYKVQLQYGDSCFGPWFCRTAHLYGAEVLGLDIRPNEGEKFNGKTIDLSKSGALNFVLSDSFDVVHCAYLFGPWAHRLFCSPQYFMTS